jgi:hypothetical protein
VTLDSTTQLTVNGLDIPLAVSDALIKDEFGTISDITAVCYNLAGEWFDVPRSEAHMGLPSAQSLLTSVLRRGGEPNAIAALLAVLVFLAGDRLGLDRSISAAAGAVSGLLLKLLAARFHWDTGCALPRVGALEFILK